MGSEKWVMAIREDFPALKIEKSGRKPIYFDNACTTLVPDQVIQSMDEYYTQFPGCGGTRGHYWFTEEVNNRIEGNSEMGIIGSRQVIQQFLNARSEKEIIFTLNASHAINIVALGFKFKPGDTVLLTDIEHNSNLIPWLRLQNKGLIKVEYIRTKDETLDLEDFQQKLAHHRVKLVSMAFTSNLTGFTLPAAEIIKLAHASGAGVLLDASQTVSHLALNVQELGVDFLAFSLHKMCGPRGVGVLYSREEHLGKALHEKDDPDEVVEPCMLGGGTGQRCYLSRLYSP